MQHATFRPFFWALFILSLALSACSQHPLEADFTRISDSLNARIGISALHIESGERVALHGQERFPMQSVYKFPIAMVMLQEVDAGAFAMADSIWVDSTEYIPAAGHSPLRDQYPAGVKLTIEDLLIYNVSKSDGTACDVLLRLLGGTEAVEAQVHAMGVSDIAIATTEMVQVAHDTIQYQNWATPDGMNELLRLFYAGEPLSEDSRAWLWEQMSISNKWFDRRIKGLLPEGTPLAHKTGTARPYDGLCRATNDAGIITLPDGSHVALTVFVSDSYDSQTEREEAIAKIGKTVYDYWVGKGK